jgi:hypothetical protein
MQKLLLAVVLAAACARGTSGPAVPADPVPTTKAVSEMAEGDLDLRPVAVAAAGYYKRIAPSGRLGFNGVYIDRLEVPRLSDEVVKQHGFVSKPRAVCTAVVRSSGGRASGPPAGTPGNCQMPDANSAFSLQAFRRVADTVYVGGMINEIRSGRPENRDVCLVLVWRDTAWTGAGRRSVASQMCGR